MAQGQKGREKHEKVGKNSFKREKAGMGHIIVIKN